MSYEQDELPAGWARLKIGDLAQVLGGGTPKRDRREFYDAGTILWATPTDIVQDRILPVVQTSTRITELGLSKSSAQLLPVGAVLFSSRASIGKIGVAAQHIATNQGFANFIPSDGLDAWYLAYCLRRFTEDIRTLASGTTYLEVSKAALREFAIPVPPFSEQLRIVAKIEALFEQSRTALQALDRIPPLLKKFRQAVLAAAFRGDLTRDWREQHPDVEPASEFLKRIDAERLHRSQEEAKKAKREGRRPQRRLGCSDFLGAEASNLPELPENWAWATVEFLASPEPRSIQSGPFGSNLRHSEFQDTGVLAIGIDNVLDGEFTSGSQHRISHQKYEQLKKYTARPLDVLMTVMATVGRCCVVPEDIETAIITKHVYRISVDRALCEPLYLMNALRGCPSLQEQLHGEIQGVTRPGINGEILKHLIIPIAPLREQSVILSRIESLYELAGEIEAAVEAAGRRADTLEQSILSRAFCGELVPQDPNDEPASILHGRIGIEREMAGASKRLRSTNLRKRKHHAAERMANS